MQKKEKILTIILVILLVLLAFVALRFNVLGPKANRSTTDIKQVDKPIKLNNTLKTSVTVLPAPDATAPQK